MIWNVILAYIEVARRKDIPRWKAILCAPVLLPIAYGLAWVMEQFEEATRIRDADTEVEPDV